MYSLHAHSAVRKDLRKLSRQAAAYITQSVLSEIQRDPNQGELLRGSYRQYRKYIVSFEGVSYRIVYQIDEEKNVVFVLVIGSREGVYETLERRIG